MKESDAIAIVARYDLGEKLPRQVFSEDRMSPFELDVEHQRQCIDKYCGGGRVFCG